MPRTLAHQKEYKLEFDEKDWDEIWSFSFEPFEFQREDVLTRGQWLAIAQMCLGKAELIENGRYDMGDEHDGDNDEWADQLRSIADTILMFFQPGDGKT